MKLALEGFFFLLFFNNFLKHRLKSNTKESVFHQYVPQMCHQQMAQLHNGVGLVFTKARVTHKKDYKKDCSLPAQQLQIGLKLH